MDASPEPPLLRSDAHGVVRLTLNRPLPTTACRSSCWAGSPTSSTGSRVDRSGAGRGARRRAARPSAPGTTSRRCVPTCATGRARPFERCSQVMLAARPPAAAGDRPGPRHRHRRRLPAGRHLRSRRLQRRRRFATLGREYTACSARRRWWPCRATWRASRRWRCCSPATSSTPPKRCGWGWSTRSCRADRLDAAVPALCARLPDKPAAVLALGKRAFYQQLELGLEAAYALTTEVIVDNALSQDFAEGLEAFVAKRKPDWPS